VGAGVPGPGGAVSGEVGGSAADVQAPAEAVSAAVFDFFEPGAVSGHDAPLCARVRYESYGRNGRESAPGSLASERRRAPYCRSSSTRTSSSVCPRIWMRQW